MAFWVFKTEPASFSWDDQVSAGLKGEEWNGVRNVVAQKNMKQMQIGDLGFFYHSVHGKEIVGVVRVVTPAHPDSTDASGRWSCVDVAAVAPFPRFVTLAEIKATEALAGMALVKYARLSVQPVKPEEWHIVCRMGGYR